MSCIRVSSNIILLLLLSLPVVEQCCTLIFWQLHTFSAQVVLQASALIVNVDSLIICGGMLEVLRRNAGSLAEECQKSCGGMLEVLRRNARSLVEECQKSALPRRFTFQHLTGYDSRYHIIRTSYFTTSSHTADFHFSSRTMWLKHSRFPVSRYVVSTTCLLFQSPGGSVPHCSRRIIALQQLHDEADYKYLLLCGQPFRFYSCQHVIYLNNTSTVYWITGLLLRSYFIRFVYFK